MLEFDPFSLAAVFLGACGGAWTLGLLVGLVVGKAEGRKNRRTG